MGPRLGHADPSFTLRTYVHPMDSGIGNAAIFDQAVGQDPGRGRSGLHGASLNNRDAGFEELAFQAAFSPREEDPRSVLVFHGIAALVASAIGLRAKPTRRLRTATKPPRTQIRAFPIRIRPPQ
jgi:hypothetical protein